MNRRELITGLGAAVVGGAAVGTASGPRKLTKHIRSKGGDIGAHATRIWLDGREITSGCLAVDTELGQVEVLVHEPVFHRVIRYGEVRVEVAGKVYPS